MSEIFEEEELPGNEEATEEAGPMRGLNRVLISRLFTKLRGMYPTVREGLAMTVNKDFHVCTMKEDFRATDPTAYIPKIVSVGPLHYGSINLKGFESKKYEYLVDMLEGIPMELSDLIIEAHELEEAKREGAIEKESTERETGIEPIESAPGFWSHMRKFITKQSKEKERSEGEMTERKKEDEPVEVVLSEWELRLLKVIETAVSLLPRCRDFYPKPPQDEDLMSRMIIDGMFLLWILCRPMFHSGSSAVNVVVDTLDENIINRDLILIENQVPWFLVEAFFGNLVNPSTTLEELVYIFLRCVIKIPIQKFSLTSHDCHLLGILHNMLLPRGEMPSQNVGLKRPLLPPVTELLKAGIKFKVSSHERNFLEVEFKDGVLEMPLVSFNKSSEIVLRNLIALEQNTDDHPSYVTSYIRFMKMLITSAEDVRHLIDYGIISHISGSYETMATLSLPNLTSEVVYGDRFHYSEICNQMHDYYKKSWRIWKEAFMVKYFRIPWKFCALLGAILVLGFTALGAVFTVMSFYKQ